MLEELQLDGTIRSKVDVAIQRLQTMAPIAERIYGEYTFMVSGGKDSSVITDLAIRSGVKCKFICSWTGLEYPATVRFLRSEKARLEALGYVFEFATPRDKDGKQITMWKLIEKKGFPTRKMRFCCESLKEFAGKNAYCVLGVRWAESPRRKKNRFLHEKAGRQIMTNNDNEAIRKMTESCIKKNKLMINPIIEWTDAEVWEYINRYKLPYNPLYDAGHRRIGCIGCPLNSNQKKELLDNPRWAALYKRAAEKYLNNGITERSGHKIAAETYFNWWINGGRV